MRVSYGALTSAAGLGARMLGAVARVTGREHLAESLDERLVSAARNETPERARIWIHAASVGEVRSIAPLLAALRATAPVTMLVTTSTTTGRDRAREELLVPARLGPWDAAGPLRRFLDAVRPELYVCVETELWPRRLRALAARGIPAALVGARLSARRLPVYRRFAGMYEPALRSFAMVAAAGEEDASRLRDLGVPADRIVPGGSLKWDSAPAPPGAHETGQLREELGLATAAEWIVFGSAHPGEAGAIAGAIAPRLERGGGVGLIVAPRHPRRFDAVSREVELAAGHAHRMSSGRAAETDRVVIADRLGLLPKLYPLASAAVVGGTFVPVGGHSPLEAAAAGCPMVAGPWISAQEELVLPLERVGAVARARDASEAGRILDAWLDAPEERRRAGRAGVEELARHRGLATSLAARLMRLLA